MIKLVIHLSFRKEGQTLVECQTLEKLEKIL